MQSDGGCYYVVMLWKDLVVNSKLLGIAPDGKAVRNWEWDLPLEFTKDDISATLSGKCLKIYLHQVLTMLEEMLTSCLETWLHHAYRPF